MTTMWQCMKDLPAEIVGSHALTFLEARDIVQMERAVVTTPELDSLSFMVRSGPALSLDAKLSNPDMYAWLCKRNLKMRFIVWSAALEILYPNLHTRVGTVHILNLDPTTRLAMPMDEQLLNKVSNLVLRGDWSFYDPCSTPGKNLHHVRSFRTSGSNCSKGWVSELLQANPTLQSLCFSLFDIQLPANWFAAAAGSCRNLQELELFGVTRETGDSALYCIAADCLMLRKLCLYYFVSKADSETGETPMVLVSQKCKLLEVVDVNSRNVTPATVSAICRYCRNLTALHLPYVNLCFADLLHLLPQHRRQPVTELACRWALQQESEVHACADLFSGLKVIRVMVPAQCEHAFAAAMPHLAATSRLTITVDPGLSGPATAEILTAVAENCRRLQQFSFSDGSIDASAIIPILAANRFLNTCSIGAAVSETLLRALAVHCPLLSSFRVSRVAEDAILAAVAGCRHLLSVRIEHCDITDAALAALGTQCRKLECVEIFHCQLVTEAGFTQMAATCKRLSIMEIRHPAIDSAAAARIRGASARDQCVSWQ